jgi:hypothetical protein
MSLTALVADHYFGSKRCQSCLGCTCAQSKFQKMDPFDKGWFVLIVACLIALTFVGRVWGKRIWLYMLRRCRGDLGIADKPWTRSTYRKTIRARGAQVRDRLAKHSKFRAAHLGQIDGQLVAACAHHGGPFSQEGEEQCFNVELVGHFVTLFHPTKPAMSMYIHPQDTVREIMDKFELLPDQVLVYRKEVLDDLDEILLAHGVPDNRTVQLTVQPRSTNEPCALEDLDDEQVHEIFRKL